MKRLTLKITAVILDMDGLMFDTEKLAQGAWERAAREHQRDFPEDVFRGVIGKALPDVRRYILQALGADFPFEQVYQRKQALMGEMVAQEGLPVKPGLLELLRALEVDGLRTAVASSSPCETILRNLERAGLRGHFDALVGGDQVQHGKPAPDIFLMAAEKLGIPQGECLVLEDSNAGVRAAHAAGMVVVMVPDLLSPDETSKALAYRIVGSLLDVKDLLADDPR